MPNIAIAVHGGAGPDSEYIKKNTEGYKKGIEEAVQTGYRILEEGGSSLDAVEAAVNALENNPLFNAGRGSALNENAEVEMDASIMNGKDKKCGAVAIVRQVKNPVTLARAVMEKTPHIYLGDMGATEFARQLHLEMRPDSYFFTEYNYEQYESAIREQHREPREAADVQLRRAYRMDPKDAEIQRMMNKVALVTLISGATVQAAGDTMRTALVIWTSSAVLRIA